MFNLEDKKSQTLYVMDGVRMRPFKNIDALNYFILYNRHEIAKYLPQDMIPRDLKGSQKQIQSLFLQGRSTHYWAIVDEKDELIGSCGFVNIDSYNHRLEIAYDLHPSCWGRGVMYNAIKVCLKHAFEDMLMDRVDAVTLRENVKSSKVLLRSGFVHEGTLRFFKYFHGKMRDVESYSFTSQDYKAIITNNNA